MDISIIIPIYNVKRYLKRCLDSVLGQKGISSEIILVDDGSSDSSGDICDEYSNKFPQIKCIHIKNSGPSSAKNVGYEYAVGNYVAFIDSDDKCTSEMFYIMLQSAYKHNADIVCCNYTQIDEEGNISHTECTGQEYVLNQDEALKALLIKDKIYSQCWTKIYKRETLARNNIKNTEGLKTEEDFIYNIQAFACSHIVCVVDKPLYIYTHRDKSLSKDYYREHISQYIDNRILRLELVAKIINQNFPQLKECCTYHCIFYYNELIGRICLFPNMYKDKRVFKVIKYIKNNSDILSKYHNQLGFSTTGIKIFKYLPTTLYLYYRKFQAQQ